ncbi:A disintegrin and metalloproteinase with thrombospondin motifs 4 [Pseudonaja textilis]|uniref:A disintegrin and metalloproteinase with thrombospondin motifs 4 n=1 Tax=Pseudonaja textilis TaxID=8673 RepID=UPI000EA87167|nr:A disintegrin and metalloproteinase with thrombospondin motifs 4 [Pseudonaja textilis]
MFLLLLIVSFNLFCSGTEMGPSSRYDEEIVYPEKLNASSVLGGQDSSGTFENENSLDYNMDSDRHLSFRLQMFGEELLLNLERDPSFFSKDLTVQYLGRLKPVVDTPTERDNYFTGTINSDPESIVAINFDGTSLIGVLQYRGTEYHIQPLKGGTLNQAGGTEAHVVRKKMSDKGDGPMCGVGAQAPEGAPSEEGKLWEKMGASPRRAKRFASIPRYVETLVVADEEMMRFHGAGLKPYLLTIMAAAAKFFRHPSVRNPVSLVVTRLVVIGEAKDGLRVTSNAAETLRNFCSWQKGLNKASDKDPEHFDTAILFTRQDLCGRSSCGTLGMADVGTVCDPARSCSIVEDDGLQSAFTAAHELGHVFNMLHDDDKHCKELNRHSNTRHMMASVMSPVNPDEMWSPCSGRFITDFLDNGHGSCLLDKPHEPLKLPAVFPGNNYNVDQQCQLSFGTESRHCPNMHPPCSSLWCTGQINGQFMCQTKYFPWADGTPCGEGKSCMSGQCISHTQLKAYNIPTNGGWGPWGPWGDCSRSCGGGVQYSTRECNKPVPRNGGKYCEGKRTQFRSCNVQDCPDGNAINIHPFPDQPFTFLPLLPPPCRYGYNDVVTIPAGATSILIRQISSSATSSDGIYLALRRQDGSYALNGNYILIPSEQDVHLRGGVTLRYTGATKPMEMITGPGPLKEPLTVQALVVSNQKTPRLKYTFFVPKPTKRLSNQWLKQKARILEVLQSRRGRK